MLAKRQRNPLQALQRRSQELKLQVLSGCPAGVPGHHEVAWAVAAGEIWGAP